MILGWTGILKTSHLVKVRSNYTRLSRTLSSLSISKDEDSTTSLGNLFQCLTTLTIKTFFIIAEFSRALVCVHCLLLYCASLRRVWLRCLCTSPLGLQYIPPKPSLLKAEQGQFFQPPFLHQVLQPLIILVISLLDSLQYVKVCLEQAQNWMQHSRCGLLCSR